MTKSMRGAAAWAGAMAVVGVMGLTRPDGAVAAGEQGAWRLVDYKGGGSIGPATGQLTLTDGRFSLVYTMTGADGSKSGRAHAGSYRVAGETLALMVEWSLDHVNGKGGVAAKPGTRDPKVKVDGDTLTLTYENGAVQTFARFAPPR